MPTASLRGDLEISTTSSSRWSLSTTQFTRLLRRSVTNDLLLRILQLQGRRHKRYRGSKTCFLRLLHQRNRTSLPNPKRYIGLLNTTKSSIRLRHRKRHVRPVPRIIIISQHVHLGWWPASLQLLKDESTCSFRDGDPRRRTNRHTGRCLGRKRGQRGQLDGYDLRLGRRTVSLIGRRVIRTLLTLSMHSPSSFPF